MTDRSSLHWFPVLVSDWLTSEAVDLMLPEQEGAFFRLLLKAWGSGASEPSIPADAASLAVLSRLGKRWAKLGPLVRAQFTERDGRLYNDKLSEVWTEQQSKHGRAVERGEKGARTRLAKGEFSSSSTQAKLKQLEREELLKPTALACSATDEAVAPEAAPPVVAKIGGDYLNRPSAQEELRKRTHVREWEPGRPPVPTISEVEGSRQERLRAYETEFVVAVNGWMDANPAETKRIGKQQRIALEFPESGELRDWQREVLRGRVFEYVRDMMGWPTVESWDESDEGAFSTTQPATP